MVIATPTKIEKLETWEIVEKTQKYHPENTVWHLFWGCCKNLVSRVHPKSSNSLKHSQQPPNRQKTSKPWTLWRKHHRTTSTIQETLLATVDVLFIDYRLFSPARNFHLVRGFPIELLCSITIWSVSCNIPVYSFFVGPSFYHLQWARIFKPPFLLVKATCLMAEALYIVGYPQCNVTMENHHLQ